MAIKIPTEERTIYRSPRTEDKMILYAAKLRRKYPPPKHNWNYGTNPADLVLRECAEYSKEKFKRICEKHSLETTGGRRKMFKRLYLHWRAAKFQTGDPYIGYGPGFRSTEEPTCICGSRKREDILREEEHRLDRLEMLKYQRKEAEILFDKKFRIQESRRKYRRFPRHPKGFHYRFPRR